MGEGDAEMVDEKEQVFKIDEEKEWTTTSKIIAVLCILAIVAWYITIVLMVMGYIKPPN